MAVKIYDLFTSLNFHIFASYHVWTIFNRKTKTESHYLEILCKTRAKALSPPQLKDGLLLGVYCRGVSTDVGLWKSRLCCDLQLVV